MAKTEAKKRLADYITVSEDIKAHELGMEYQQFITAMKNLDQFTQTLYTEPYPILDAQTFDRLRQLYAMVGESAKALLAKQNKSYAEKQYASVVRNVYELVNKDLFAIHTIDVSAEEMTLPQLVGKARTTQCKVAEGQRIKKVGNMLSSRIPMKIGNRTGFFSKLTRIDENENIIQANYENGKKQCIDENPAYKDELEAIFKTITKATDLQDTLFDENNRLKHGVVEETLKANGVFDVNKNYKSDEFKDILYYLIFIKLEEGLTQNITYKTQGAANGESIEERNDAFYDMSKLFSLSSCVPVTNKIYVNIEGNVVEGSFMDTAVGSDFYRMKENDPLYLWSLGFSKSNEPGVQPKEPKISSKFMKRVADTQVLDFVCGNIDRHMGNLFYQFTQDENGNLVLDDLSLIDNDNSFHAKDIKDPVEERDLGLKYKNPKGFSYISKSMADKVNSIQKEDLKQVLRGHSLCNKEIEAAWNRVEYMREVIQRSNEHYAGNANINELDKDYPRIITDEEFSRLKLTDVAEKEQGNLFYNIRNLCSGGAIRKYEEAKEKDELNSLKIHYVETELISAPPKTLYENTMQKLRAMSETLYNNTPVLHINSKSYNKMKTALDNLRTAMDNSGSDEDVMMQYQNLAEACRSYIGSKGTLPKSEYGKQRLEMARRLRDVCVDRIEYVRNQERIDAKKRGFETMEDYYQHRLAEKLFDTKYSIRRQYEEELSLSKKNNGGFHLKSEKEMRDKGIESLKKLPAFRELVKSNKVENLIHVDSSKLWKSLLVLRKQLELQKPKENAPEIEKPQANIINGR